MKEKAIVCFVASLLLCSLCVVASAAGPFDKVCPNCNGTGTVISHSTETCSSCQGSGEVTTTDTCPICQGSGETTDWQTCYHCGGDGKSTPSVILKSTNGYGTLVFLDWVARVEGVFHNEEDEGTYGRAKSIVYTVTENFVHFSDRTYLPPHEDVTITIDTPEIELLTDWTYSMYLYSVDDITCSECDGSGGESVLLTCIECNGAGTVTTTGTCSNCQGTGQVTTQTSLTCQLCNGSGYVTNWTSLSAVAIVVFVVLAGTSMFIIFRRRQRQ